MKNQIKILAQYSENYASHNEGWDGKKEAWKPKGGVEFIVNDDDIFSDFGNDIEQIAKNVLAKKSNLSVKYEFIDFDRVFEEPTDITAEFKKERDEYYKIEEWIDPAGGVHSGNEEDPAAMYV